MPRKMYSEGQIRALVAEVKLDLENVVTKTTAADFTAENGKCYYVSTDGTSGTKTITVPANVKRCYIQIAETYNAGTWSIEFANDKLIKKFTAQGQIGEAAVINNEFAIDDSITAIFSEDYAEIVSIYIDGDIVDFRQQSVAE